MSSFPPWLDRATLEWAADYCELMAIRLGDTRGPDVGADICARGLREARFADRGSGKHDQQRALILIGEHQVLAWTLMRELNP